MSRFFFTIPDRIFKTCNACSFRARQLRRDRSPTWGASVSLSSSSGAQPTPNELNSIVDSVNDYHYSSSSSSASASVSYFVPEPEPEPEPNFRNKSGWFKFNVNLTNMVLTACVLLS